MRGAQDTGFADGMRDVSCGEGGPSGDECRHDGHVIARNVTAATTRVLAQTTGRRVRHGGERRPDQPAPYSLVTTSTPSAAIEQLGEAHALEHSAGEIPGLVRGRRSRDEHHGDGGEYRARMLSTLAVGIQNAERVCPGT